MSVIQETPQIISLYYKPEPNAPHRYYCEWARFYLDLKNYTLSIESDCGNYSYGWVPTPNSESFLKLCSRFDKYYLLSKISNETVVDGDATWENIKKFIEEIVESNYWQVIDITEDEMEQIHSVCYWDRDERNTIDAIISELNHTELYDKFETYEIYDCIVKDYPIGAKHIAEIFINEIQPYIEENLL